MKFIKTEQLEKFNGNYNDIADFLIVENKKERKDQKITITQLLNLIPNELLELQILLNKIRD